MRKFGAARATVVGVAHEAGMTHANVYRYFPSKTALLEEITAAWLRPIEARLREAAESPDPAADKLENMLMTIHRAYRQKLESDPALFDLLIEALEKNRGSARRHRARVSCQHRAPIQELRATCHNRRPPNPSKRGSSKSRGLMCEGSARRARRWRR